MTEKNMDAVTLLTTQHREMEGLLEKLLNESSNEYKKTLFARVADQLTVHIASEERIFYPAVKAARTEDDLLESLEEHLSLKRLLADLIELDPSDKTFEPKFKVLKEQAEHHHEEEEEHLFPEVRKLLDDERLRALGKQMMSLQLKLTRNGEPREAVANETSSAAPLR